MAKSSKKYWFDRIAAEKQALASVGDMVAREKAVCARQSAAFDEALAQIDAELEALRKDVGDAEMNRAMMQQPLTPKQLENWSKRQEKRLDDLIAEYGEDEGRRIFGKENAQTAKRDRANRIVRRETALKQSIEAIASGAAAKAEKVTAEALQAEAKNGADAFKKQFKGKAEVKFNTVSPRELDQIAKTEWRGGNYSERIWTDRDEMVKDLERAVNLGVTNGWSIQRMKKEVERHVQSGKQSAARIARTEMNHVSNAAEMAQYEANGIHYYRFVATEDARTCEICGKLHDHVFAVADAIIGENFPPVHPNCRCRTVGSFVDSKGNDDDDWLDELIDEAEEEIEREDAEAEATGDDGAGDNDKETPAPISQAASKTLVEDGTISRNIDHVAEYDAIQEKREQDASFDDFILAHVETAQWHDTKHERVPRLDVLKEAQQCYAEYLANDDTTRAIDFHFGHPNSDEFTLDGWDAFEDTGHQEDFRTAGGAFGVLQNGQAVLIVRSTITLDGLHHEIGHAIHERYLGAGEKKDPDLTKAVENVQQNTLKALAPFGIDRQATQTEPPKSGFELTLLKALSNRSQYKTVDSYNADSAQYAGLVTAFHNINAIIHSDTGHGIHYGESVDILHDPGWKELFANSTTILLSGNEKAIRFFNEHYGPIAQYVQERLTLAKRGQK